MRSEGSLRQNKLLWIFVLAYAAASLLHYAHNAAFLSAYPNLPHWLGRTQVWLAWVALTAVGACAVLLTRSRSQVGGLIMLAVYALFGFDGLGHYVAAPLSAHTLAMNLTICLEVVTAALLLAAVAREVRRQLRFAIDVE
ncbi:MAG TPA: hypothetical protein VEI06_07340 [Gemmatimonadaceae bacterium]|nr:hypothetical protein [Gemmatimonadaceae bacterium]